LGGAIGGWEFDSFCLLLADVGSFFDEFPRMAGFYFPIF
jgi:hypothetical protein